jgi:hypothetical protein
MTPDEVRAGLAEADRERGKTMRHHAEDRIQ